METVRIHGRDVTYRLAGDGPLIVLVHGMAGSGATWDAVIPKLAERFTVLAPDLPGHGASAKPVEGDYSLGSFAGIVRDLMVTLGYEHATIVGQSLGGGIAMQFAYQFPTRCERLVLVGSGGLGQWGKESRSAFGDGRIANPVARSNLPKSLSDRVGHSGRPGRHEAPPRTGVNQCPAGWHVGSDRR